MKLSEKIRRNPHIVDQQKQHEWSDEAALLEEELEYGDYWMERHEIMVSNGGCPVCFRDDESIGTHGHFPGCELEQLEAETAALKRFCLMVQESIEGGRVVTFQDVDIEELDALLTAEE